VSETNLIMQKQKAAGYGAFENESTTASEDDEDGSQEEKANSRDNMAELTPKAMILGCILSVVLGAANAYLGLKVGMTVSASIPASVMSMAVLSCFESHTVLENNQVQTCAASGPSVTAGAIFTIPALLMSGYWDHFGYLPTLGIILVGGLLGILFTIPLRSALVVNNTLRFPEGVATAAVLETGAKKGRKGSDLKALGYSSAYGVLTKVLGQGMGLWAEDGCQTAWYIGKAVLYVGTDLSLALVGVGYIVGLNIAFLCFAGGFMNWWVAIPMELMINSDTYKDVVGTTSAADLAGSVWSTKTRYLGVGAMTVGGLWALISLRHELVAGVRAAVQGVSASNEETSRVVARRDRDLPWQLILPLLALGSAGFIIAACLVAPLYAALVAGCVMLVAAFLFSAVAAYMAGLVGSSNSPISGITISSILVCSLLLLALMGSDNAEAGATAAVVIGSMVCCAAAIGGDNMQDLKCGRLVGATPWKQQVSQIIGVLSGALVIPLVLELLRKAYGFEGAAGGHKHPLPAPQAGLMQAVAQGVFEQSLPWPWVFAGATLAVLTIMLDEKLKAMKCAWHCPVLAVAVGVYLPWSLSGPMVLGGIVQHLAAKWEVKESATHMGTLVSSGLITGEALAGIALAVPVAMSGKEDVLYIMDSVGPPCLGLLALMIGFVGLGAAVLRQPTSSEAVDLGP